MRPESLIAELQGHLKGQDISDEAVEALISTMRRQQDVEGRLSRLEAVRERAETVVALQVSGNSYPKWEDWQALYEALGEARRADGKS